MSSDVDVDSVGSIAAVLLSGMLIAGALLEVVPWLEALSLLLMAKLANVEVGGANVTDGGTDEWVGRG